jgi:hypothetical protein
MSNEIRVVQIAGVVCLTVLSFCSVGAGQAQAPAADVEKTANPELVGQLTKSLSITPAQASGGAGALFALAKSKLNPADFGKVAESVPGIEGLIKSAPAPAKSSPAGALAGGSLPGALGGLASVAGPFKKLGLSPDMAAKFVPVLTQFVQSKGGAGVAGLLAGALK